MRKVIICIRECFLKYWFLFLVTIILLCSIIFFQKINNRIENGILTEQIITIYGISTDILADYVTILTIIIGSFWAVFQYNKSVKLRQQEKGQAIAEYFSEELVERFSIIGAILSKNKFIQDNVLPIDSYSFSKFNTSELKKVFKTSDICSQYRKAINTVEVQEEYTKFLDERYNDKEKENMPSKFLSLIDHTLNKLEAVCMNISSNAAGSEYIYPSLHQIFLRTIHLLSIKISSYNDNSSADTYFINIIHVYNRWNNLKALDVRRLKKIQIKIDNKKKSAERAMQKVESQIEKISNKKPKTV